MEDNNKMETKTKVAEFEIGDLLGIAMTFVVIGIALTYGIDVQSDVRADQTADSLEYNASTNAMTGVSNIAGKLPTLATIVIAAVIIGILVRYMVVRYS